MAIPWTALITVFVALILYLVHVNRGLSSTPQEAQAVSPKRFDKAAIIATYERLLRKPIQVQLPPKTGRRYIIVGGAGFLPGWVVVQLLERGEDPRRIRIVDFRPPRRQDLTTGLASNITFHQADVRDADAVLNAFRAPWKDGLGDSVAVTVFHSAANIRFWERLESLLPLSSRVNVVGTQNVIAACRAIGANILVYTSSASVATKRTSFWFPPWQRYPQKFVQVLNDDTPLPSQHSGFFSNYAASKAQAERIVRTADKTHVSGGGILRTGCIRPGNGVYGPGGDVLAGAYLVQQINFTWVRNIIQSFVYVENCALAHLLYEQRLLELSAEPNSKLPDIGGQAFNISDEKPIAFGDIYTVLTSLTTQTKFHDLPPALMLALSHVLEAYYILRLVHPILSRILPAIKGRAVALQPSLFSLTQIHLVFEDSRARKSPKEGGLGYQSPWTTMEALCKLVIEWGKEEKREEEKLAVGGRLNSWAGSESSSVKK